MMPRQPSPRLGAGVTSLVVLALLLGLTLGAGRAQAQPFAYVTNQLDHTVSVMDTATNTVTATVPVGGDLRGVAVTPDGQFVYVANFNGDNVPVIATATNTVTATVPVGNGPWAFGKFIGPAAPTRNEDPIADAGSDQTVNEGTVVTLDGSGSRDPDGDPLTYTWTQLAGPTVTLSNAQAVQPTFTAPQVSPGGETLTFQLIVNDGHTDSAPDSVDITVKNVNHPPVADAGNDQTVNEGTLVTLDGSASYDPDNDPLTYSWLQTGGPAVTLSDPSASQPTFTAPQVGQAGATLTFQLTVSDGLDDASATSTVMVENVNHAPSANAGPDQTKDEGSLVRLDGTASSDPDGDPLTYTWTQTGGTAVVLSDPHSPTPTFMAPQEPSHSQETLTFQLVVEDGGASSTDTVAITVVDVDAPPACGLAQASPASLWPPTHKMVLVAIVGVTDPDNDQVSLSVTQVRQDEPVNGLGDGDTSPDAIVQGAQVLLRAERSGQGNGRVYQVSFTADDGFGGRCTETVTVCVPHDRQPAICIDDGPRFDATQP